MVPCRNMVRSMLWVLACVGLLPDHIAAQPGTQPTKAARSVHLTYTAPDGALFYNEVIVEKSVPGSYFMAAGFHHGYFGMQEQKPGEGRILFSVWDPTKGDDPNAVAPEQRVEVLGQSPDVTVKRFGGEGTGAQSFIKVSWRVGVTYKYLVQATVTGDRTAYAGYFYSPDAGTWKHMATFRIRTGGENLKGYNSFVEDFRRDVKSAGEVRAARFGNGWVMGLNGQWMPLLQARFGGSSAPWEAKDTVDAGVNRGWFYLQTGGETRTTNALQSMIQRPLGASKPPTKLPIGKPLASAQ